MSNYEDMRDFQMREQYGDSYVTPTRAYTGSDLAEWSHDHDSPEDPDGAELLNEVMTRDMARYDSARCAMLESRIRFLESLCDANGIDTDEDFEDDREDF